MSKLIVLSGAGLSAPSGIPTFRDSNGLWENHNVDQVANFLTWKENRDVVHSFYNDRRTRLPGVQPNAAHRMMADWQARYPNRVVLLTQNIDDLLERAGCIDVVHLHGFLQDMKCTACGHTWNIGYSAWDVENDRCPKCTSRRGVKPGVVFFNESAPKYAVLHQTFRHLTAKDTVIIVGTSGQVIDVNAMVFDTTAYTVLNNLEASQSINNDYFNRVIYKSADDAAEELDTIVRKRMEIVQ